MRKTYLTGLLVPISLLTLVMALPAADPPDEPAPPTRALENVLVGRNVPLTVKFRDMDDGWRQLTISSLVETDRQNEAATRPEGPVTQDKDLQTMVRVLGAAPGVYYTQGQTVTTGADSFLVAYRVRFDEAEFKALFDPADKPPTRDEVLQTMDDYLRDQTLELSLVNLRLVGSMNSIRPFSLDRQAAALRRTVLANYAAAARLSHAAPSPAGDRTLGGAPLHPAVPDNTEPDTPATRPVEPALPDPATPDTTAPDEPDHAALNAISARSVNNLKQIGEALSISIQDHDGVIPDLTDAASARRILGAQMDDTTIFVHPKTKEPYQPNPILSGKKLVHITNPAAMVAFYEASPDAAGMRAVLFLDGHVKRVKETEWPRLKQISKIDTVRSDQTTVPLNGAAAPYYLYQRHQDAPTASGPNGRYFLSKNGRVYYRDLKTGAYQWVVPPPQPIQVPSEEAQVARDYSGYNGDIEHGKPFGGYGPGQPNYEEGEPIQPAP